MISPKQLAERAGVSPQYIRQLCREGKLRASKPGGRDWVIGSDDAERWLKARQKGQKKR